MKRLLLTLLLVGCRPPALDWEVYPGRPTVAVVQCESRFDCIRVAHRLCPHGFSVLDSGYQVEHNRVAQAFENAGAAMSKRDPINYTRIDSSLTVQCVEPPSEPPRITVTKNAPPKPPPAPVQDPWGAGL